MLEEKDFQSIGKLLDEKFKENNKILKDEIVAEIGAATSQAFSAVEARIDKVEARIDKIDVKVDKLGEEMAKRPTLNQIMSWGDKTIIPLGLDIDKLKYLHLKDFKNLPPQQEISRVLVENDLKLKNSQHEAE